MGIPRYSQLADRAWLAREYAEKGRSCAAIAAEVGCSAANVDLRLRQYGIPRRSRGARTALAGKTCERCKQPYQPNGPAQKLCDDCWRVKTCQGCDNEFTISREERRKDRGSRRYCDACVSGKRGAAKTRAAIEAGATGHRRVTKAGGYVEVNLGYQPLLGRAASGRRGELPRKVHPEGYVYLGRVSEHRWWMERRMGRSLLPDEEVHHRNGDRTDNDRFCKACQDEIPPELGEDQLLHCACGWSAKPNLEVWLFGQPKGQRAEDLLRHALDVMLRSDPGAADALLAEYGFIPSGQVIELPILPA